MVIVLRQLMSAAPPLAVAPLPRPGLYVVLSI